MQDYKIPREILSTQATNSGKKQLKEKGKEYFSELGKRSAAKRKNDKRFGKDWYRWLSKRGAAARKAKREGKQIKHVKAPIDPLRSIATFLTDGKINTD